jgi:aspartate/methionine/tyrosine aminotransferase
MEDWLSHYKDTSHFNLGESGMPDITVGELLRLCGENPETMTGLVLKDNDTRGTERLRHAVSKTYHPSISPDNITVTTGTSEALFILFNVLLHNRTSAVVPFPSFQALYEVPRALGTQLRLYHLTWENKYIPDPDELCNLIDDTTGVVVINTPHNPSGIIFPQDIADMVIRKASFHGAVVVSDEHYRFLPLNGLSPINSLARLDENVVATGSITKCFGVIGLRMGWIVAPSELIQKIRDFRDYLTHTLSPVSDYLATSVLEHAPVFIEPYISTIRENCGHLSLFARETRGISVIPPEAGIVAFPRYDYPVRSSDFTMELINNHGVFVLPGSSFEVENHFRINLGQPPLHFQEALSQIHEYCSSLVNA